MCYNIRRLSALNNTKRLIILLDSPNLLDCICWKINLSLFDTNSPIRVTVYPPTSRRVQPWPYPDLPTPSPAKTPALLTATCYVLRTQAHHRCRVPHRLASIGHPRPLPCRLPGSLPPSPFPPPILWPW